VLEEDFGTYEVPDDNLEYFREDVEGWIDKNGPAKAVSAGMKKYVNENEVKTDEDFKKLCDAAWREMNSELEEISYDSTPEEKEPEADWDDYLDR
jgi:hypothetical protein